MTMPLPLRPVKKRKKAAKRISCSDSDSCVSVVSAVSMASEMVSGRKRVLLTQPSLEECPTLPPPSVSDVSKDKMELLAPCAIARASVVRKKMISQVIVPGVPDEVRTAMVFGIGEMSDLVAGLVAENERLRGRLDVLSELP